MSKNTITWPSSKNTIISTDCVQKWKVDISSQIDNILDDPDLKSFLTLLNPEELNVLHDWEDDIIEEMVPFDWEIEEENKIDDMMNKFK